MAKNAFEFITFDEGIDRIETAIRKVGKWDGGARVVTSRESNAKEISALLEIADMPDGFKKWQLPVYFRGVGAQFFITSASPGAKVGTHSHSEGSGIRFVVSGSIFYDGKELTQGDWMFIPEGAAYSLEVGPLGATMCYCYQCCCVPR